MTTGFALLAIGLSLLAIGWTTARGISAAKARPATDFASFFLRREPLSQYELVATLAATNTALALIIFWFSYLGWLYGLGVAIWLILAWVAGLEIFAILQRRWKTFPGSETEAAGPEFQTLHEYAAAGLRGEWPRRVLAIVSIITFILMMNVELTRGVRVLEALPLGDNHALIDLIALALLLATAGYAAWGGFVAIVKTDAWQWSITALALLIAGSISVAGLWGQANLFGSVFNPSGPTARAVFLLPDQGYFIIGSLFSWGLWFAVTMDMWQRAAASRRIEVIDSKTRIRLYPWFTFLTVASVSIGLFVRIMQPTQFDQPFPAVTFLPLAFDFLASTPALASVLLAVVVAGFLTALVSTLDTYFVVVAHSVIRDLPRRSAFDRWNKERFTRAVPAVITFGIGIATYPVYMIIAHLDLSINALLYLATSSPFILVPAVLFSAGSPSRRSGPILGSVLFGSLTCIGSVAYVMVGIDAAAPAEVGQWYNLMYLVPLGTAIGAMIGYMAGTLVDSAGGSDGA